MFASITRRDRRSLWGTLSFTLIAGAGLATLLASAQQRGIERDATRQARLTAQVAIAPLLQSRDLQTPAEGSRYESLSSGIETAVLGSGPPQTVTLWGQDGRILFSPNASVVGTKQASMQDFLFGVANGQATSEVDQGWFQSFVPLWLEPGGTVIVAELDRPYAPIVAQANKPWRVSALACAVLALVSMTFFGLTFRATKEIAPATALAPMPAPAPSPRRVPRHEAPVDESSPAYMLPGYRQEAEARREAEARAAALEENYYGLQTQYRQAIEQLKALDQQVLGQQSSTSQTQGEVELVRDELKQTAQRLHLVEVDRDAVKARLALRESELERLQSKLHTSKLQDALLELDGNPRGGNDDGNDDGNGSTSSPRLTLRPQADEDDGVAPAARKVG